LTGLPRFRAAVAVAATGTALALALAGCGAGAGTSGARYPTKPITMIVGFPPGAATDIEVRALQAPLEKALHTSIVIKNIAGGASAPALEALESAPADGYTVMAGSGTTEFTLAQKLTPYGRRDVVFLAQMADPPLGLWVSSGSPYRTLADLMAYARSHPGKVTVSGVGAVSSNSQTVAFLEKKYGVKLTYVPTAGGNGTVTQVLGHHVTAGCSTIVNAVPYARAGKLRVLWIAQDGPLAALPSAPTSRTLGLSFTDSVWFGFMLKHGTPASIRDKLAKAFQTATSTSTFADIVRKHGDEVRFLAGKQFNAEVNDQWTGIKRYLAQRSK
jgi:putative tricarboxylic transport membrane protein